MKKVFAILAIAGMFAFTACNNAASEPEAAAEETTVVTEEAPIEEAPVEETEAPVEEAPATEEVK